MTVSSKRIAGASGGAPGAGPGGCMASPRRSAAALAAAAATLLLSSELSPPPGALGALGRGGLVNERLVLLHQVEADAIDAMGGVDGGLDFTFAHTFFPLIRGSRFLRTRGYRAGSPE